MGTTRYEPWMRYVRRGRVTRAWVNPRGPGRGRTTTLVFRLPRPGRVRVTVVQVAPECRSLGTFTVRGRAGVNRVVFGGRLHGRPLPVGTYRLSARARGRALLGVTIVVSATRPSARALARARAANACMVFRVTSSIPVEARGPVGTPARAVAADPQTGQAHSASAVGSVPGKAALPRAQALGAQFGKVADGRDLTHAFLVAAAALAILLLGLAALPEAALAEPRLAAVVETRRIELALAGASTLLSAVLVYLATG
jgi:hypothetical protein